MLSGALDDFHTHTPVVVWAFPESGLVVVTVDGSVSAETPEPLSVFLIDYMCLDEFPAHQSILQTFLTSEMIPEIELSDHSLGLHPPVAVSVGFFPYPFVYHTILLREAL